MSFHPEKCNVLTISRKKQPIMNSYTLHGHQLEHPTTAKYLDVSITLDMKWNQHISNTFLWMEAHFPSFFPSSQFVQVILKIYTIDIRCYGKIYDGIISEQSAFGSYIFWQKKQPIVNSYTLHGQQLEHVTTAKYLGVSITSDMK
jgi:myo-inositol-hexaphosphate 3-phosphohydrolase